MSTKAFAFLLFLAYALHAGDYGADTFDDFHNVDQEPLTDFLLASTMSRYELENRSLEHLKRINKLYVKNVALNYYRLYAVPPLTWAAKRDSEAINNNTDFIIVEVQK